MAGLHFNIWAILIIVGAAHGLFLAFYLFSKSDNRYANKWLALLLTIISLHLIEYAANITGLTLHYPIFIAITYPLLFCMGPVYYIYCRYLLDRSYKTNLKTLLHLIPSLAVLLMMMPFYTMPHEVKIKLISDLTPGANMEIPTGQLVFMGVHVVQTVLYIFGSYRFIRKKQQELKDFSSDVLLFKKLKWLNHFSLFFSIYFLLYFIVVLLLTFINSYQVQLDYVLLLITAISIYAIGYSAINNPEIFKDAPTIIPQAQELKRDTTIQTSKLPGKFPELKEKLLHLMDTNKPYLKSDLKISELADQLIVPGYQLSQLINEEFLVNFYDFVNKYRVEEAKRLLLDNNRNYKIIAIAYEVGFNSKATFNRVFKKFTGLTPSDFKENISFSTDTKVRSQV